MSITITITEAQRVEIIKALDGRMSDLGPALVMNDEVGKATARERIDACREAQAAIESAPPSTLPEADELPGAGGLRWTRRNTYELRLSNGHSCATVMPNGYWHTWDQYHVGGENSRASTVEDAARECVEAVARQGFDRESPVSIMARPGCDDRLELSIASTGDTLNVAIDVATWESWGEQAGWACSVPTIWRLDTKPDEDPDDLYNRMRDIEGMIEELAPFSYMHGYAIITRDDATGHVAAADLALTMLSYQLGITDARRTMGEHGVNANRLPISLDDACSMTGPMAPYALGLTILTMLRKVNPIEQCPSA